MGKYEGQVRRLAIARQALFQLIDQFLPATEIEHAALY
jgi:hypothetical protein